MYCEGKLQSVTMGNSIIFQAAGKYMIMINIFISFNFQRREGGSRRSAFLTSENANNNILKGNRRISSNSSMSTAVSTPSFRSSYSAGSSRMGSKRVIATVNNASFRQGINRFH